MNKKLEISNDGKEWKPVICSPSLEFSSGDQIEKMVYRGVFHVFDNKDGSSFTVQLADDPRLTVGVEYLININPSAK